MSKTDTPVEVVAAPKKSIYVSVTQLLISFAVAFNAVIIYRRVRSIFIRPLYPVSLA